MSNDEVASKLVIREKIENTWALMKYFKNTFSESEYDDVLELRKKILEEKLLAELNLKKDSNEFLAHHYANLLIKSEREIFNLRRVQLFLNEIEYRLEDLMNSEKRRAKGGRKRNDLMYEFASIEIERFKATHDGKYPSAMYLSEKVSLETQELFNAIKSGLTFEVDSRFIERVKKELEIRDNKLEIKGTKYLPSKTAETYLEIFKLENIQQ